MDIARPQIATPVGRFARANHVGLVSCLVAAVSLTSVAVGQTLARDSRGIPPKARSPVGGSKSADDLLNDIPPARKIVSPEESLLRDDEPSAKRQVVDGEDLRSAGEKGRGVCSAEVHQPRLYRR